MKKLVVFVLLLVVFPAVLLAVVVKLAATPLTNLLLSKFVDAPAKVERVETDWFLTRVVVENLRIDHPEGFGKGPMLSFDRGELNLKPASYFKLKPVGTLEVENFFLHYKEKNGISNFDAAFKTGKKPSGEKGEAEFKVKQTQINATFDGLEKVSYQVVGFFEGFGNDAEFTVNGAGNIADPANPQTVNDFVVYNWIIRNKLLTTLTGKPEIKLTRIEGTLQTDGPWLVFVKRNTKAYTVGNVLFAEVYKGSKYNRVTKELDIRGVVYLPAKVEFHVTGTADNPKVDVGGLPELKLNLPDQKLLQEKTEEVKQQLEQNLNKTVEDLKEKVKEQVEQLQKPLKELQQNLNNLLQNIKLP
ncbi:MAG: hypothetical protein GXO08_02455 [Aquificae bacterium]|nr:hypothetical protein [Aquificota bacterium]